MREDAMAGNGEKGKMASPHFALNRLQAQGDEMTISRVVGSTMTAER